MAADGIGENGGVEISGRLADARGRGVDPLDGPPPMPPGVLCEDTSPVRGVSERLDRALLGVREVIGGRWPTMVSGVICSPGDMAVAQGLFEGSSTARVRLSLLLSRMLFGSPRTALALVRPEVPATEVEDESGAAVLEPELEVSGCTVLLEGFPALNEASSSIQPAGVGGTGPRDDTARVEGWPGRRVGGEEIRSMDVERLAL